MSLQDLNPVQTFPRVDPTATTDNRPTPIELAVSGSHNEVLNILLEYTEMPNQLKLSHLAKLMNADDEEAKAEFKKMLSTMPLDLVRVINLKSYKSENFKLKTLFNLRQIVKTESEQIIYKIS